MTFPNPRGLGGSAADAAADPVRRPRRPPSVRSQSSPSWPEGAGSDRETAPGRLSLWARQRVSELTTANRPDSDELYADDAPGWRPLRSEPAPRRREARQPAGRRGGPARSTDTHSRSRETPIGLPGVGSEAVREAAASDIPSPLRKYAKMLTARADLVNRLANKLSGRHGATVHALYDHASDQWSVAWEQPEQVELTRALLVEAAAGDRELEALFSGRDHLRLGDRRLDLVVWARRMALLDALVDPETQPAAADTDEGPPRSASRTWFDVLPRLCRITRASAMLTYYKAYEYDLAGQGAEDTGAAWSGPVAGPLIWSCFLEAGSTWWSHKWRGFRAWRWLRRGIVPARQVLRTDGSDRRRATADSCRDDKSGF